jgi:hypothetical protein
MDKHQLWVNFLHKQEVTAGNLFVLAGLAVLFWWLLIRGRRFERWANLAAVIIFLGLVVVMGVFK